MSPDDEVPGGVAVAPETEAEPIPEDEAVPAEEAPAEEPEGEEEAAPSEEEAEEPEQSPVQAIVAYLKENPDDWDALTQDLPDELRERLRPPDAVDPEQLFSMQRETAQSQIDSFVQEQAKNLELYSPQAVDRFAGIVGQRLQQQTAEKAKAILENRSEDTNVLDPADIQRAISPYVSGAVRTAAQYKDASHRSSIITALLHSPVGRYMSQEHFSQAEQFAQQYPEQYTEAYEMQLVSLAIQEAARLAPETLKKQALEDAQKQAGVMDKAAKLKEMLGKGKSPARQAERRKDGRPTPQEYAAASAEQRAKWHDEGVEPVVG